jgi:uncharacterized protein (TIGR00297 family)
MLPNLQHVTDYTLRFDQVTAGFFMTLGFAVVARLLRAVTLGGAVAGAIVSFILYVAAGPGAFVALVTVFVLAWVTTRLGYTRKQHLGTAEAKSGRRTSQVLANLTVAALAGLLSAVVQFRSIFLVLVAAALAEAAADTVSSEYGQAIGDTAILITTGERVPAGTDGAVTQPGTVAGLFAAAVVAAVCFATSLISLRQAGIAAVAAFVGMLADSLLGATLERRKIFNNDAVNFLGTLIAALLTLAFIIFIAR